MLLQMAKFCSFLWRSSIPLCDIYLPIYCIFFIRSSVDGHLGCFHMLAIVNKAAVNIEVHVSFQICVFGFFGYIPRSGIPVFSFLRNLHTVFCSGCTILTGVRWYLIVVLFCFVCFLFCLQLWHIVVPRPGIKSKPSPQTVLQLWQCWILNPPLQQELLFVVLICISLMVSDSKNLFTCLLMICFSFLEKCLVGVSAHLRIFYYLFIFSFWGLTPRHMGVPRLGVELMLQLLAYTSATAIPDLNHICDLCCSLWQQQFLNPLSEARDWTHILTDTSRVLNLLSHRGNS